MQAELSLSANALNGEKAMMFQAVVSTLLTLLLQNGQDLYQQALIQERAAGNLDAAIQLYQDAARHAGGDRALAAQALLGAARCYEKLGVTKAREIYEDIQRSYSDQQQAGVARERLNALQGREQPNDLTKRFFFIRSSMDHLISVAPGMFWQAGPDAYDPNAPGQPISITGTVTKVEWINPNVTISIESKAVDGSPVVYRVPCGPPSRLLQDGFPRGFIKPGDAISVEGVILTEFPGVIRRAIITLPDGRRTPRGLDLAAPDPNENTPAR